MGFFATKINMKCFSLINVFIVTQMELFISVVIFADFE